MKRLIIDTHNLIFMSAYGNSDALDNESVGLLLHESIIKMNKYFKQIKPDQMVLVFEGKNNWRKDYTKNSTLTERVYKANRVRNPAMDIIFEVIDAFRETMMNHTSLICLQHDRVEGDDLIAGYVQEFSSEDDEIHIISSDKDFIQLLKYPNVHLLNPLKGEERTCEDVEYFIFEKCIRGDSGDNVGSAYPRVRSTKLQEAFNDDYKKLELFEHEWKDKITEKVYRVGDLFEENKKLMILDSQPDDIREIIKETVTVGVNDSPNIYDHFYIMKFFAAHNLIKLSENIMQFVNMFSINQLNRDVV